MRTVRWTFPYNTKTELFSQTACHKAHIAPLTRVHAISQHQSWRRDFLLYWNVHFQIQSREKSGKSVAVTRATDHWGYISCLSLLEFDSELIGALPLSSKVKRVHNALVSPALLHVLMLLQETCTFRAWSCFCSLHKICVKNIQVSAEAHPPTMVLVKGLGLIALQESRFEKQVDISHNVIALLMLLKHDFNHTSFWHWTTKKNNNNTRRIRKRACFAQQNYYFLAACILNTCKCM